MLAKDINHIGVTRVDFFFADEEIVFVTGDEDGVLRIYEYNPTGRSLSLFQLQSLLRYA